MSEFQAQCWFWVCPDCSAVIESIREVHCDGTMRGKAAIEAPDA